MSSPPQLLCVIKGVIPFPYKICYCSLQIFHLLYLFILSVIVSLIFILCLLQFFCGIRDVNPNFKQTWAKSNNYCHPHLVNFFCHLSSQTLKNPVWSKSFATYLVKHSAAYLEAQWRFTCEAADLHYSLLKMSGNCDGFNEWGATVILLCFLLFPLSLFSSLG